MSTNTKNTVLVHSHRGEDGANVLATAGPGAIVRRAGYRRHWVVTSTAGQLVQLVARHHHPAERPARCTTHADELTLVRRAHATGGAQ